MLNIFIMTVQFHANRWGGCAVHAMSHLPRWDSVFLLRMTPNISRREEARGAHRAMQRKRISFVNYHDKSTGLGSLAT